MTDAELAAFDAMAPKVVPPGSGSVTQDDLNNFDNMAAEHHQSLLGRIGGALSSAKDTALNFVNPMLSSATGGLAPIISTPMQMAITGNPNPMSAYRQLAQQAQPTGNVGMAGSMVGGLLPAALAPETMAATGLSKVLPVAGDALETMIAKNSGSGALQGLNANQNHPVLGTLTGGAIGGAIPAAIGTGSEALGAIGQDAAPWLKKISSELGGKLLGPKTRELRKVGESSIAQNKNPFGGYGTSDNSPGSIQEVEDYAMANNVPAASKNQTLNNALELSYINGKRIGATDKKIEDAGITFNLNNWINQKMGDIIKEATQNERENEPQIKNALSLLESFKNHANDKKIVSAPVIDPDDSLGTVSYAPHSVNIPKKLDISDVRDFLTKKQSLSYDDQGVRSGYEMNPSIIRSARDEIANQVSQKSPDLANEIMANNKAYNLSEKIKEMAYENRIREGAAANGTSLKFGADAGGVPFLGKLLETFSRPTQAIGAYGSKNIGVPVMNYLKNGMNMSPIIANSVSPSSIPSILNYLNQGNQNAP